MTSRGKYNRNKQRKRMFYLYASFLAALSVSVILMPYGIKIADKTMMLTYLSGVIFWIGLIGTIIMAAYITYSRKRSNGFQKEHPNHRQLGLIHFFQNVSALIFDILLFISLIGFALTRIRLETTVFPFIFLSLLIFSFGMHCMMNGSNYIYINYRTRRETDL